MTRGSQRRVPGFSHDWQQERFAVSRIVYIVVLILVLACGIVSGRDHGRLEPISYSEVEITSDFWSARLETNRKASIPHAYRKCRETGVIRRFAEAAGVKEGRKRGLACGDPFLYKLLEGMAYAVGKGTDGGIRKKLNRTIDLLVAAQSDDGYVHTGYQLAAPGKRWTNLARRHELYAAGHLIEAAVADHVASGDKKLLGAATHFADLIHDLFGPDARHDVPGHPEIELALIRLWEVTGEERYLDLAEFFVEQRGNKENRPELYGKWTQDHRPIRQQEEATGHCVRAMYLYSAIADLVAIRDLPGYREALARLWDSVVNHKMYVTGGIGVEGYGEGFAEAYYLPNQRAYAETCAAIGMCFWNHRMTLLTGDSRYADVFERVLYNGMLSGVSLDGKKFFYTNPLESEGDHHRSPWFRCACCPPNLIRFLAAMGQHIYAVSPEQNELYINHYVGSVTIVPVGAQQVTLRQRTEYPWEGEVEVSVRPESPAEFGLCLRIPDWARGTLDSTDLYSFVTPGQPSVRASVNGRSIPVESIEDGWLRINRRWKDGDTVVLQLPMTVKRVRANEKIAADRGKIALMRGPVVYCLEAADHDANVPNMTLPRHAELVAQFEKDLIEGVITITGAGKVHNLAIVDGEMKQRTRSADIKAVPYYAWDNRSPGAMKVWIPETGAALHGKDPTVSLFAEPSCSYGHSGDAPLALNDAILPVSSGDLSIKRFTWWSHRGTEEWVQYEWEQPVKLSHSEVYWFDDTGRGQCRVPESWQLLYRKGNDWTPVDASAYPVEKDRFCAVGFEPIRTKAIRLRVTLQPGYSGGILEWRVSR